MKPDSPRILINGISVRTGGAWTFMVNLIPRLALHTPGWSYHLLVQKDPEQFHICLPPNVIVDVVSERSVNGYLRRFKFEHLTVPRLHRERDYAVHFQIDEMMSPAIRVLGKRSIAVFHTTPLVLFDDSTGDSWLLRQYARWIRKKAAHNATAPVTVSYHAKAEFAGLYPSARDRFHVIYHGIDLALFSPEQANSEFVSRLGLTRPYVLSISNRFEWKNYYRLIQAYHKLIETFQIPFDLVLVGEAKKAAEEERIGKYIDTHSLGDRIHLLDFVAQSDLPQLYRAADAYVFPSMRETFGLTVLEAMACGLPVACARWGPLPEVAGDAAYYFNPLSIDDMAQAMMSICTDTQLRADLVVRSRRHVQYFTWERAAREYAALIQEILDAN